MLEEFPKLKMFEKLFIFLRLYRKSDKFFKHIFYSAKVLQNRTEDYSLVTGTIKASNVMTRPSSGKSRMSS